MPVFSSQASNQCRPLRQPNPTDLVSGRSRGNRTIDRVHPTARMHGVRASYYPLLRGSAEWVHYAHPGIQTQPLQAIGSSSRDRLPEPWPIFIALVDLRLALAQWRGLPLLPTRSDSEGSFWLSQGACGNPRSRFGLVWRHPRDQVKMAEDALFFCHRSQSRVFSGVVFNPDGQSLASVGDLTVRLWDASTGAAILVMKAQRDYTNSVAFTPDGRRLISTGGDGTAKLWDTRSGLEIVTLDSSESEDELKSSVYLSSKVGADRSIFKADFDPHGKFLVTLGARGVVRTFDARPPAPELQTCREVTGVVAWYCSKSLSDDQVVARITSDGTISDDVRRTALSLVRSYSEALARRQAELLVKSLLHELPAKDDVCATIDGDDTIQEKVKADAKEILRC